MQKNENPLFSLLLTIVIPSFLLEKLSSWIVHEHSALISLIVALSFPITYGVYDYISKKNKSPMAILGVINISLSGGFALFQLSGPWFTIKEAAFPFFIGVFVYLSSKKEKNFFQSFILNPQFIKIQLLEQGIKETASEQKMKNLLVRSNRLFAVSFFFSALLNFILAYKIFIPIKENQANLIQAALNSQVAKMNWMSFVVIALPLMLFSVYIFIDFFKKLKTFSNLGFKDLIQQADGQ